MQCGIGAIGPQGNGKRVLLHRESVAVAHGSELSLKDVAIVVNDAAGFHNGGGHRRGTLRRAMTRLDAQLLLDAEQALTKAFYFRFLGEG